MTQTTDTAACSADDVVITRELETRPSRAPDHEGENRALRALAEAMSTAPDTVLQKLVEMAMALTRSDSSGISLLEPGDANGSFRWVATTGAWSPYRNGTMPREASPCGEVVARRSILLMKDPARAFPALLQAEPGVGEALLAPFSVGEVPAGTLWVIKHGLDCRFEAEDARLLESLSGFASAAHQTVQALQMAATTGQYAEAHLEQLVTLADVSSDFFGTCDMDFNPTYGNAAAMRMVGLTDLEQVKRTPISEFFFPEDLAFITEEFFPRVLREGHGKVEIRFRHFVTGEPVWVDYRVVVLKDATGRATGLGTVTHDLTERKRTEAALHASEARGRNVLENMSEAFVLLDRDFRIVDLNAEAMRLEDRPREAIIGKTHWEAYPGAAPELTDLYRLAMAEQREVSLEHRYVWPDGRDTWLAMRAFPVGDGLAIFYRDVTDRKVASEAVCESEERQTFLLRLSDELRAEPSEDAIANRSLRMLFEHMRLDRCYIGIYRLAEDIGSFSHQVHDDRLPPLPAQVRLSDFPEAFQAAFDRTLVVDDVVEMESLSDRDRVSFDSLGLRALIAATLRKGENNPLWAIVAASTCPRVWTQAEVSLVEEVAERTWASVERARTEVALRESEAKYRSLFETMGQGYALVELVRNAGGEAIDQRYLEFNPAVERLLGVSRSDAVGKLGSQVFVGMEPYWTDTFDRVVRDRTPGRIEQFFSPLGRWFEINAYPAGGDRFIALYDDVTDRKDAEVALRESEERQVFLLKLSDALRPLANATEIMATTSRLLGAHMSADRVMYSQVHGEPGAETGTIHGQYVRPSVGGTGSVMPFPEHFTFDQFGKHAMAARHCGETLVVANIDADPEFADQERTAWAGANVRAAVVAALAKDGRLVTEFGVHSMEPRDWTRAEIALIEEVAERTWAAIESAGAGTALRESEERFRSVTEAIDDVFYMTDLDQGALLYLSPSFERIWGMPPTEMLRDLSNFVNSIHPEDRPAAIAAMAVQRQGQPAEAEYRILRPDGEIRWIHDRCFPVSGNGRRRSAGVASDVTARKAAEAALRDSEALFRQFNEFSSDVIWIRDAETMQFEYVSPAIETVYGVAPEEFASRHNDLKAWAEILHPDDRAHALDGFRRVRAGERVTHEFRIQRPDGEIRWIRDTDFPLIDDRGRVQSVAGIGQDITDIRRGDERQKMLLAELQHRVRNILAMIRSVTVRSAETAESVEDYCQHLEGRIGTMARTQNLLTRHVGSGVDLQNMILDELNAQAAQHTQFFVTGPDVALPAKAAEVLALAVHELATNAVKYGAFDTKGGSVDVRWAVLAGDPVPKLSFIWSESGVRIDTPPTHRGFGTELITERVPYELRGIGNMEFRNSGLVATIEFPLIESASILQTDPGNFDRAS